MDGHTNKVRSHAHHDAKREEIRPKRSLKTGILSAMIHAMTHIVRVIATQDPMANQVFSPMCLVPRKSLTYLDSSVSRRTRLKHS